MDSSFLIFEKWGLLYPCPKNSLFAEALDFHFRNMYLAKARVNLKHYLA